jgi:hypothetical protein
MKSLFLFAASLVALVGSLAQATVIDDFSVDSSAKYNQVFTPGAATPVYGRNAANQFQSPATGIYGDTTIWLRNDNTFDVGDTVGIDVVLGSAPIGGFSGLFWSSLPNTFITNDATNNTGDIAVERYNGVNTLYVQDHGVTASSYAIDASSGSTIAVKATRTALDKVTYDVAYTDTLGTARNISGSVTESVYSTSYHFGMIDNQYSNGVLGANNCMDNLSDSSAVPEPGTIVLLATGLFGLLAYAWRKQK